MQQEPQQDQQNVDTGKRAVLDRLVEQNSELREISFGGIEEVEQGLFVCSGIRNDRVLYVNCNVLIIGEQDPLAPLTGRTEIRSYAFDSRGVVKPIYQTTVDSSGTDPRGPGYRAEALFEYLMGITEGRGFEQCEYVKIGQQGELLVNTNGTSCVLPRSYNPKNVSEMCVSRKKIRDAEEYLRSLAKDPKLKNNIGIHVALLILENNSQSLENQYHSPESGWVQ